MVVTTYLKARKGCVSLRFWKLQVQSSEEMRSHCFTLSAYGGSCQSVQNRNIYPEILWKLNQLKLKFDSYNVKSNLKS